MTYSSTSTVDRVGYSSTISLGLWDLFRGAQAAIVVYDITNQDTFGRAKVWVKELQRQASPNIVIALAGNKADLAAKRAVEFEEAKAYAEENTLLFMETSAKTAMNVNDIFLAIGTASSTLSRDMSATANRFAICRGCTTRNRFLSLFNLRFKSFIH